MKNILTLLIFISIIIFTENKNVNYRCGINKLKKKLKELNPKFIINKDDPLYKRRLSDIDKDGFKTFNIYVDKYNIKKDLANSNIKDHSDIIINSLDKAANTLQKLLRVKPLKYGYQFSNDELENYDIHNWDTKKFGDDAVKRGIDMNKLGIDLVIFATIDNDMDEGTIAAATPCYTQISNHQPILGIVYINNKINFTKINTERYIESVLIHEMTHILGFSIDFFDNYFHFINTKRDIYRIKRFYLKSEKLLQVARKYFNCSSLEGVELENYGDEGTAGSHWEARILLGDYMNGVSYTEEEVISEFTLALLEDLGFYKPYYYTGGLMRYGKNKGCDFVKDKCINSSHMVNPKFENEFFDNTFSNYSVDASCSSGRLSRTYNIIWEYINPIPKEYRYFNNIHKGGWASADYCPVSQSYFEEEYDNYFSGSCYGNELGVYGSQIIYEMPDGNLTYFTNKELSHITGEEISKESFCFLSSLFINSSNYSELFSRTVRASCYNIFCSEKSLTIKINRDYVVCPRSGGKIKVEGYKGYFLCPDYYLMCSGSIVCNEMFDCVDKQSEVKEESYIYDYEIKTSQKIERAELSEEDNINNYEISDNGICPKYCKHCLENKKCLKCKDDYYLLGNYENAQLICEHKDKLIIGHYLKENHIYYKCMDNCDKCLNYTHCEKCKEGIDYNYNKCINININNCEQSDSLGICQKCKDNYAFNATDRNFCIEKKIFDEYYYEINNSFFLCSNGNLNCKKCEYDNTNKEIKCNLCENDYALFLDGNKCLLKEEIDENKNYYCYMDNSKVKKCLGENIKSYNFLVYVIKFIFILL